MSVRRRPPNLFYGGVRVAKVFALDRTSGTADVHLMNAVITGSFARVTVAKVTGTVGDGQGAGWRQMSDAEVWAELERRAGVAFGTRPAARATGEPASAEVGYGDAKGGAA